MDSNLPVVSSIRLALERDVNIFAKGDVTGEKLLLLLHGYGQSAEQIMKLLGKYLPQNLPVLCFDGPHHVVTERKGSLMHGYAWYFFDRKKSLYLTKISEAEDYVLSVLKALDCEPKDLVIVGYSQGGYLAPYVGKRIKATSKVVGVNSRFRTEDLATTALGFSVDGIHGENDVIVETEKSKDCHQQLLAAGSKGQFQIVRRSGHKIDRALGKALRVNLES